MTKPTDRRRTIYIHVLSAIASDLPCSRFGSDARSTEQWLIPTQNRRLCPLVSIPTKPTWTISAVTLQRKAAVKWRQVVLRVERLNGRARQSDPSAVSSALVLSSPRRPTNLCLLHASLVVGVASGTFITDGRRQEGFGILDNGQQV